MVFLKPGCLLISGFLPRFAGRWYLGCWTTCSTRLRWNDETATFGWPKLIKSVPSGTQLSQARMLLAWPLMDTNRLDTGEFFILSILWPCYRMILHVLLNKILRFDASEYESHYSHFWLSGSFNLCIVWLCVCMLFHCSIVPLFHYCIIYVCITVIGWLSCHPCDLRPRRWRKKTARSQIAGVADDSAMVYDRYNLTMVYSYKWLTMMILIWLWDDVNIQTWRTDWPDWIPVPIWPIFHQPIGAVLKRSGQVSGGEPSENTLKVGQAGLKRICCSWWLDYYCNIYKYL